MLHRRGLSILWIREVGCHKLPDPSSPTLGTSFFLQHEGLGGLGDPHAAAAGTGAGVQEKSKHTSGLSLRGLQVGEKGGVSHQRLFLWPSKLLIAREDTAAKTLCLTHCLDHAVSPPQLSLGVPLLSLAEIPNSSSLCHALQSVYLSPLMPVRKLVPVAKCGQHAPSTAHSCEFLVGCILLIGGVRL